ncbi:hypothetical protein HK102_007959 [Quaeritorhiza haematococci]|nr:hypothetical protein HK102_007959 [Quaeritorhiza haematococci]
MTTASETVQLAFPSGSLPDGQDVDPYMDKIGGRPVSTVVSPWRLMAGQVWFPEAGTPPTDWLICAHCKSALYLVAQLLAPTPIHDTQSRDRLLYVFACNKRECAIHGGSWKIVRAVKMYDAIRQRQQRQKQQEPVQTTATSTSGLETSMRSLSINTTTYPSSSPSRQPAAAAWDINKSPISREPSSPSSVKSDFSISSYDAIHANAPTPPPTPAQSPAMDPFRNIPLSSSAIASAFANYSSPPTSPFSPSSTSWGVNSPLSSPVSPGRFGYSPPSPASHRSNQQWSGLHSYTPSSFSSFVPPQQDTIASSSTKTNEIKAATKGTIMDDLTSLLMARDKGYGWTDEDDAATASLKADTSGGGSGSGSKSRRKKKKKESSDVGTQLKTVNGAAVDDFEDDVNFDAAGQVVPQPLPTITVVPIQDQQRQLEASKGSSSTVSNESSASITTASSDHTSAFPATCLAFEADEGDEQSEAYSASSFIFPDDAEEFDRDAPSLMQNGGLPTPSRSPSSSSSSQFKSSRSKTKKDAGPKSEYSYEYKLLAEYQRKTGETVVDSSYGDMSAPTTRKEGKRPATPSSRKAQAKEDEDDAAAGATWAGEVYEKVSPGNFWTKEFKKFQRYIERNPTQCVRYGFGASPLMFCAPNSSGTGGGGLTVLHAEHNGTGKDTVESGGSSVSLKVPRCSRCGSSRVFEFQLMPNTLCVIPTEQYARKASGMDGDGGRGKKSKKTKGSADNSAGKPPTTTDLSTLLAMHARGMDFSTVLVYTCGNDCFWNESVTEVEIKDGKQAARDEEVRYFEEVAVVQLDALMK